jgi:hypothetical protein
MLRWERRHRHQALALGVVLETSLEGLEKSMIDEADDRGDGTGSLISVFDYIIQTAGT